MLRFFLLPLPASLTPHFLTAKPQQVTLAGILDSTLASNLKQLLFFKTNLCSLSSVQTVTGSFEKIDLAWKIIINYTFYFSLYSPQLLFCSFFITFVLFIFFFHYICSFFISFVEQTTDEIIMVKFWNESTRIRLNVEDCDGFFSPLSSSFPNCI